jgi:hypothetical protein
MMPVEPRNRALAMGLAALAFVFNFSHAEDQERQRETLESLIGPNQTGGTREIARAVDVFARERAKQVAKDELVQNLEQIRYMLAALAGQEEQLAGLLSIGLQQARESRAGQGIAEDMNFLVNQCWATFGQLRKQLAPITSMPNVDSDLIGGLHSFMADSVLFARDETGHQVFAVRGNNPNMDRALALASQIQHESEQIATLARLFERQIKALNDH